MKDDGHMQGMDAPPPPPPPPPGVQSNGTMVMSHPHRMMMHMTFFWGKNAEILFDGWPGYDNLRMYVLALAVVFLLAFFVEWLAHSDKLREALAHNAAAAGMVQTVAYAVKIGLAYLVMLSVMSFNAGVFLVAVAGHAVGFFLFGSAALKKPASVSAAGNYSKANDLHHPVNSC